MAEIVSHTLAKISHWPAAKRRQYLILALQTEKSRARRRALSAALVDATTKTLKSEMRRKP